MVCIRKATLADIPEAKACDLLCFPEKDPITSLSFLNDSMFSPSRVVYVAEHGGFIVGFVVAGKEKAQKTKIDEEEIEEECGDGYISWLGVHPDYRKLGIASKLMTAAENSMAQEYGCEYVYLHVGISNHAALNLYAKVLRYKFHCTEANYYGGEDAYLLRKQLTEEQPLPLAEAAPKAKKKHFFSTYFCCAQLSRSDSTSATQPRSSCA
ncbi:hypothetical protein MKW94_008769 [Papaver nudicaule]|uniref:N-acetyltransferase domain-containing protein n=1 Tax=Papaver nudicaule TaxID=74823 RepID=A0AA41VJJ7_PAPNU|nr:hypothetical protein [Papaver nudicaule]